MSQVLTHVCQLKLVFRGGGTGGDNEAKTDDFVILSFYYNNICRHANGGGRCTYVGVGLPDASQGKKMSSREKAVYDVGISVNTGG